VTRKSLGNKVRFEVFKRDLFACQYCGASAPDVVLEVDHIHPVSKGGDNSLLNLVTSCEACNSGKSNRLLGDQTMLSKQKAELDRLEQRRSQLVMLMEWRRELAGFAEFRLDLMSRLWESYGGSEWDEGQRRAVGKLFRARTPYTEEEVLSAMDAARDYLVHGEGGAVDSETKTKAAAMIPRICHVARREKKEPWLREMYYARRVLENRLDYFDKQKATILLRGVFEAGADADRVVRMSKEVRNWTEFRDWVESYEEPMQRSTRLDPVTPVEQLGLLLASSEDLAPGLADATVALVQDLLDAEEQARFVGEFRESLEYQESQARVAGALLSSLEYADPKFRPRHDDESAVRRVNAVVRGLHSASRPANDDPDGDCVGYVYFRVAALSCSRLRLANEAQFDVFHELLDATDLRSSVEGTDRLAAVSAIASAMRVYVREQLDQRGVERAQERATALVRLFDADGLLEVLSPSARWSAGVDTDPWPGITLALCHMASPSLDYLVRVGDTQELSHLLLSGWPGSRWGLQAWRFRGGLLESDWFESEAEYRSWALVAESQGSVAGKIRIVGVELDWPVGAALDRPEPAAEPPRWNSFEDFQERSCPACGGVGQLDADRHPWVAEDPATAEILESIPPGTPIGLVACPECRGSGER